MLTEEVKEARTKRLAVFDWQQRGAWALDAIIVIGALALAFWWTNKHPNMMFDQPRIAAICNVDYARARTAAESLAIDHLEPTVDRESAPLHVSCRDMRRAGTLH